MVRTATSKEATAESRSRAMAQVLVKTWVGETITTSVMVVARTIRTRTARRATLRGARRTRVVPKTAARRR